MVPRRFRDDPDVMWLEDVLSVLGIEPNVGFDSECGWFAGACRNGEAFGDRGVVYFRRPPLGFWCNSWSGESLGAAVRHFVSSVGAGGVVASCGAREADVPRFSSVDELRMKVSMAGGVQWRRAAKPEWRNFR